MRLLQLNRLPTLPLVVLLSEKMYNKLRHLFEFDAKMVNLTKPKYCGIFPAFKYDGSRKLRSIDGRKQVHLLPAYIYFGSLTKCLPVVIINLCSCFFGHKRVLSVFCH